MRWMLLYSADDRTYLLLKYLQVFIIIRIVVASQRELLPYHDAQLVAEVVEERPLIDAQPPQMRSMLKLASAP